MAALLLTIAGGVAGSFYGALGIGLTAGAFAGSLYDYIANQPPEQYVGKLDSTRLNISSNASPIPIVKGKMRLPGNIIWATDLIEGNYEEGGGISSHGVTYFTYACSFAVLVCEGPATVTRIFDEKGSVIYDRTKTPTSKYTIRADYDGTQAAADTAIVTDKGAANTPAFMGMTYVVFDNMDLKDYGFRIPNLSFEVQEGTVAQYVSTSGMYGASTTLEDVLGALFDRAGLDASEYDVSAGTDALTGFAMLGGNPVSDYVEPLLRAFACDLVAIDGKLVLVKRGGSSVVTIPEADLGASSSGQAAPRWELRKSPDLELPRRWDVTYYDPELSYQQGVQSAIRFARPNVQDAMTLNIPVAISGTIGKHIAERLLYTTWREREPTRVSLPPKYAYLTPSDPLTATVAGETRRWRIEEIQYSPFGELGLQLVPDDTDILSQIAPPATRDPTSPTSETSVVPTEFDVWSGITVKDGDVTSPGFYVVANGDSGWRGGRVQYSVDGGSSYLDAGVSVTSPSVLGVSGGTLADWTAASGWDTTHSVSVTLTKGILEPASQSEVNNGLNRFLLGSEVIGVSGATLTSGTTYTLSTLLRRLRSTGGTGHAGGERFYELKNAVFVPVDVSLVGSAVLVKVVSFGELASAVTGKSVTISPATGAPWTTPTDVATSLQSQYWRMFFAQGGS